MSKKKLVFKVSQGLAVTGLALSFGAGCAKEKPIVNPVEEPLDQRVGAPATNNATNSATNSATNNAPKPAEDVNVNVVEAPSTNNGTAGTNNDTTATPEKRPPENRPELKVPIRVNTPPPTK